MLNQQVIDLGYVKVGISSFGEGRPLFLIPGFPFSSKSYYFLQPYLDPGFQVTAIDLPGMMGNSEFKQEAAYTIIEYAKVVVDTIKILYPDQQILVGGASIGGILSLLAAYYLPTKVTRVFAVATPPQGCAFEENNRNLAVAIRLAWRIPLLGHLLKQWLFHFRIIKMDQLIQFDTDLPEIKKNLINEYWSLNPPNVMKFLCDFFQQDFTKYYRMIQTPVVLIGGMKDKTFPIASIRETAVSLVNCKYIELPDADHLFVVKNPQLFTQIIKENS